MSRNGVEKSRPKIFLVPTTSRLDPLCSPVHALVALAGSRFLLDPLSVFRHGRYKLPSVQGYVLATVLL